jgi:hypothetical protein
MMKTYIWFYKTVENNRPILYIYSLITVSCPCPQWQIQDVSIGGEVRMRILPFATLTGSQILPTVGVGVEDDMLCDGDRTQGSSNRGTGKLIFV